jgi:hypothetical protein
VQLSPGPIAIGAADEVELKQRYDQRVEALRYDIDED